MNHFIPIVFFTFVAVSAGGCIRDNTEQKPRGANVSARSAHTEMAAATADWHHWRSESIRARRAGKNLEAEACDRLADSAYDRRNMYYHRIQIGDFSLVPTAAEEKKIRDAEAKAEAEARATIAAEAYADWLVKANAEAQLAGFADWRAKANAEEEIVRLAAAAKAKANADAAKAAAKAKSDADAAWLLITSDPVALAAHFAAADAKYDAAVAARSAARATAKSAK